MMQTVEVNESDLLLDQQQRTPGEALDELPLITRANSFPLPSPNVHVKIFDDPDDNDAEDHDQDNDHHKDDHRSAHECTRLKHQKVSSAGAVEPLKSEMELDPDAMHELRRLLKLIYPVVFTYVLEYLPGISCVMLVGHIDSPKVKQYVDAATLSTMFTNITALSVGFGLSSALDTLCSQAYGAGKLMKIGLYLQSAMLVIGSCLIPIFLLNWNCGLFLRWVGQDEEVAELAGNFSRYTVFGVPFLLLYEMNRKLLQAQNIMRPLVMIAIVGNVASISIGYFLTYHTSLGFYGAALARSLGYVVMPLLLIPYYGCSPSYKRWWPGWNLTKAKQHVGQFLSLGVPGMLMMVMEWWAYEILALMCGWLPDSVVSVSAHAVLMQVASALFMVYLGIAVAGNIRVGNALGANMPRKAQLISRITFSLVSFMACCTAVLVYLCRSQIPAFLMNDPVAIERASACLIVMVPYEFIDGINCVMQGIFRGTGRQHIAAGINAVAFYVVGLPVSAVLAFKFGLSVEGLWIGFGSGVCFSAICCALILSRSSWDKMAHEAQERTAH